MIYQELYGPTCSPAAQERRYRALGARFERNFRGEKHFFSSSGRIEILGNHTDHNHGKVLVGTISADTLACVTPSERVVLKSEGYRDIVVELDRLDPEPSERGTSLALVKGVLAGCLRRGRKIGGFSGVMISNIFKGAGVSSSAAFEVLIAEIMNVFYNEGRMSGVEKAQIAQFSENEYFGKPCGLLDQTGIALGGICEIDFSDPGAPGVERLSLTLDPYRVVVTNTGGDHSALTEAYASIRREMEQVAAALGGRVLREVPYETFLSAVPALSKKLPGRAILRAMHFYDENARVEAGAEALRRGDREAFFRAVNGSGDSSAKLLQNLCVSGDTAQRIPLAVEFSRRLMPHGGAVRVHGGGFAGTILAFVHAEDLPAYLAAMGETFGADNVFTAEIRTAGTREVLFDAAPEGVHIS